MDRCGRCGWKYGGFHVCVDLSVPHPLEGKLRPKREKRVRTTDNIPGSFNDMPNWGATRDHSIRWRG